MSDSVVELRGLAVQRGGRALLDVERLSFDSGGVTVVLGLNGAGKTTLLQCLLGVVRPTVGEVRVLGCRIAPRPEVSLSRLRRRIGYVPQGLAPRSEIPLTVREVVAIGRTGIAGLFRPLARQDWDIVDAAMEQFGLADLASRVYSSLSGGEQRKTLIAKAMVQRPEILLLDEPTANLDLFWREQIVATLEQLHAESRLTILLVCHELEVIPACASRLLLLQKGEVVADGRPEQVLTPERVESLNGTRRRMVAQKGRFGAMPVGGLCRDA
jgi:ABC-type cobalamin/Fe3+-siderophores transport system ATPase subunit